MFIRMSTRSHQKKIQGRNNDTPSPSECTTGHLHGLLRMLVNILQQFQDYNREGG